VTINVDSEGLCEVFTQMGKSGGCAASQSEALSRIISVALRAGVDPSAIVKHLRGIRCPTPAWAQGGKVLSCADAVGIALEQFLSTSPQDTDVVESPDAAPAHAQPVMVSKPEDVDLIYMTGACPECGSALEHESGCAVCRSCGFSRCA
jgi:ribonucleoside-diphosphate reductase alpha chain